jgi:ribosomal-protein-serine acetyltransferase
MDSPINTLVNLKRLDAGDGVVMRPLRMYHGEEVFSAVRENRDSLAEWLPWPDAVKCLSDTRDFIRTAMDQQADGAALQIGIWADGAFAGGIGLHAVDWDDRRTSIGYWLGPHARGRGVMTTCARALTDFALCDLKLSRVEMRCAEGNHASRAVPERLGYVQEGTAREDMVVGGKYLDCVVYAALAREWRCGDVTGAVP